MTLPSNLKDLSGVFCSAACLMHCLMLPALAAIGISGAIIPFLSDESVHLMILIPVLVLAILSFPSGFRHHRQVLPGTAAASGVVLLISAQISHGASEIWLTSAGALILIAAHLYNRSLLNG